MQCILQQYYVELHTLFISSKLLPYQKAKSLELMSPSDAAERNLRLRELYSGKT